MPALYDIHRALRVGADIVQDRPTLKGGEEGLNSLVEVPMISALHKH